MLCTYFLLIAGGTVTSMDAGLAVPDWPTSYGNFWFLPMPGNVFYEHGHRLVAQFVGLLTLVLAAWVWRTESRIQVRKLSLVMVVLVILQGILGGITVLYMLPPPVSVAHGCLAQAFFCCSIVWAYCQSREWQGTTRAAPRGSLALLRRFCLAVTAAVFLQLVLGATVRHTGSALAIPDFPRALGQWIPPLSDLKVAVHFAHRLGAVLVLVGAVALLAYVGRRHRAAVRLTAPALFLLVLVLGQVALGAWTVLSRTAPPVATLHVVTGAAILALATLLTLRSFRDPRGLA